MKIYLAGYNTDVENQGNTPETLSAAYARISRDPRPIPELRQEACREVEKARASNRRIVFQYGHGSVAEHAVFNFDILGVSRLAAEALQDFRLASFTEKSQRYIHIGKDLVIPRDLQESSRELFSGTAESLFERYEVLLRGLKGNGLNEERAKEDSRYILPLATSCQMGMTVNARELEHMVRRLSCHPLAEVRDIASRLLELAMKAAPSLFLFLQPTAMDSYAHSHCPVSDSAEEEVVITSCHDDSRIGRLLIQCMEGVSLEKAQVMWSEMDEDSREELFLSALEGLGIHDSVPRQWEFFQAEFQLIVSASAYAQLKRHRMCSRLTSVYDPVLGVTVPESVLNSGMEEIFSEGVMEAEKAAGEMGQLYPYLLTNAHRRRAVMCMNGRELYHFSRLREDEHAQWDIRRTAGRVMDLLRERAPLTFLFSGGKSDLQDSDAP